MGIVDRVFADIYIKENTGSIYLKFGTYVKSFLNSFQTAMSSIGPMMFPTGSIESISDDLAQNIPLVTIPHPGMSYYPFILPGFSSIPSPIIPLNYDMGANFDAMIAMTGAQNSTMLDAGLLYYDVNPRSASAKYNLLAADFAALGGPPNYLETYLFSPMSTFIGGMLSPNKILGTANVSFSGDNGALNWFNALAEVEGLYVQSGATEDFKMYIEIIALPGEYSSIIYTYSDPPEGDDLVMIIVIVVSVIGAAVAIVVVGVVVKKKRSK
jgi:hypothetical protein